MVTIISKVKDLLQHLAKLNNQPAAYKPKCCPHCAALVLWGHGCYNRQSDRVNGSKDSLNPVPIPRFICKACRRTCSSLPECMPPRRWYLWDVQQVALLRVAAGASLRDLARQLTPSRHTLSRWIQRFKTQCLRHASILRSQLSALGRCQRWSEFWPACLKSMSLAQAMRICHNQGVLVP